jgi:flagellar basal-body rod modification protein FlgD
MDPQTGQSIRDIDLDSQSAGTVPFAWDGLDNNGELVNPGIYSIAAQALIDGNNTALPTNIKSQVKSVTMGNSGNGLQVNLNGLGAVKFNEIKQIL